MQLTVKELIDKLSEFDPLADVWICNIFNNNNVEINSFQQNELFGKPIVEINIDIDCSMY